MKKSKLEEFKTILWEYIFAQKQNAENNYIQQLNNIKTFNADQYDINELLNALIEKEVTEEILNNIADIIKLYGKK